MIKPVELNAPEGFTGEKASFVSDPWEDLYEALQIKETRQHKVSGVEYTKNENGERKANLVLFFGGVKGIIPEDEVGEPRPKGLGALIGAEVAFKVVRCDRANNVVYLSRKAALEEMSAATWQALKRECAPLVEIQEKIKAVVASAEGGTLSPEAKREIGDLNARAREIGPVKTCTVRSVFKEGAYVDIGGVSAFLPVHEISWGRVSDAREVLRPGQAFDVRVIRVDYDELTVRVSLKATMPDPWETADKKYVRGGSYSGTVVRYTDSGNILAELEPGITVVCDRLPLQRLKPGERVKVKLLHINRDRRYMRGVVSGGQRWVS